MGAITTFTNKVSLIKSHLKYNQKLNDKEIDENVIVIMVGRSMLPGEHILEIPMVEAVVRVDEYMRANLMYMLQ
jgi:hypothetical protein